MIDGELLQWVRDLIQDNKLHEFYTSPVWRKLQADVLRAEHYECSRCRAKGLAVPAKTVHHIRYLREHPELALDRDNLEALCDRCHYEEHHTKKPGFMNEERW